MPTEYSEMVAPVAAGVTGGLVGGTVTALSRPMTRREVFFCLFGGLGIGAFAPPAVIAYYDLPPLVAGAIGFAGGVSVFGVISGMQLFTNRWIASKTPPENKP